VKIPGTWVFTSSGGLPEIRGGTIVWVGGYTKLWAGRETTQEEACRVETRQPTSSWLDEGAKRKTTKERGLKKGKEQENQIGQYTKHFIGLRKEFAKGPKGRWWPNWGGGREGRTSEGSVRTVQSNFRRNQEETERKKKNSREPVGEDCLNGKNWLARATSEREGRYCAGSWSTDAWGP